MIGFWALGNPGDFDASYIQRAISDRYDVSAWAFLPVLLVVVLSVLRTPPCLAILGGALLGALMACILQPRLVLQPADHHRGGDGDRRDRGNRGGPRATAMK